MKKLISVLLASVIAMSNIAFISGCGKSAEAVGNANISCLVMGDETAYNQLTYGIVANAEVSMYQSDTDINDYDIIFLNESGYDTKAIEEYVKNGGTAVIDNSYADKFSMEFLGADKIVPLEDIPVDLEYHYTEDNLKDISELLYDYTSTLKGYLDFNDYTQYNYGYAIHPTTARVIAGVGGNGVYTINEYGEGTVFMTNPILPSDYTVTELVSGEAGEPMAFTTSAAESMLRSYFVEYVSKKKYGFAVERTFGPFATSPAAWQLHYEEIKGIANKSMISFAEYCMKNNQLPSFTLVRNPYTWFKRAESISYFIYDSGYKNDAYENAYCSGTHIASGGKWLEMDYYEDTDSYFVDSPQYVKRAYPCPIDWNEDGNMDIITGSADGNIYYYEGKGLKANYEVGAQMLLTDADGKPLNVGAYSSPVVFDINGDGRGEIVTGAEDGIIRAYKSLKTDENPNSMAFSYIGEVLNTGLSDAMISVGHLNDDNIMDMAVGSRYGEMRIYYGYTEDGHNTMYRDYVQVQTDEEWISPCIYNGSLFGGTREGYVASFEFDGNIYKKTGYLTADTNSKRGNKRISTGMNAVPRFYDIDGDGDDDLLMGCLEYGMAYPIDSEYFPYKNELSEQLEYMEKMGIYVGVHGLTHKFASPEQEAKELEYHKNAFDKLGLRWDGKGVNQHTWFASRYGYDKSGINGYNPDYNGTYKAQSDAGLLWNSGSTLPESDAVPQDCAENALPMPVYMADEDFILFEPSNTPHGDGSYTYLSTKYQLPLLFYNHCDNMYSQTAEQEALSDKVGEVVEKYDYMFMSEDQLAKAVSAIYNTNVKADIKNGKITISREIRNENMRLYDESYSDCVGVKVVFADTEKAQNYTTNANVSRAEDNELFVSLDRTAVIKKGEKADAIMIKGVNIPADIRIKSDKAVVRFKDGGEMIVRVSGVAKTSSKGWTTQKDGDDTVFIKFGKADTLKITG